jgi:hypothetical protein
MFRVAVSRCALAVYLIGLLSVSVGEVGGCGCCGRPGLFRGAVPLSVNSSGCVLQWGGVEIEREEALPTLKGYHIAGESQAQSEDFRLTQITQTPQAAGRRRVIGR